MTPYFFWDYKIEEKEVRKLLHSKNLTEKVWVTSRILESASFEDVWKYLTLKEIKQIFPFLKLKKPVWESWKLALSVWQ